MQYSTKTTNMFPTNYDSQVGGATMLLQMLQEHDLCLNDLESTL